MENRAKFAAELEKLGFPPKAIEDAVKIQNRQNREIATAFGFGAGVFIATQLVLRYRFGNI